MPEAPLLYLLPERRPTAPIPDLPYQQARVDRAERWNTGTRWGDLTAPRLANVLLRAEQGDTADWADLCKYMVGSDDQIASLYDTRISRVAQADFVITPNRFGDPRLAEQAADMCNELMGRVKRLYQTQRELLDAVFVGYSCVEADWRHDSQKYVPGATPTNYIDHFTYVHAHRFRYDEQWQLRLYDRGDPRHSTRASRYGEALDPRLWTVNHHQMQAGYPGIGGLLRSCAWRWMFRRWVDKLWIGGLERNGAPIPYAKVPANTPASTRNRILEQIQDLISASAGVIESPDELLQLEAATQSFEGYENYMAKSDAWLAKAILGVSDAAEPGENGARGAVETRVGMATDPRMVTDGKNLSCAWEEGALRQMIAMNAHKFTCPVEQIPVPELVMQTADDEVETDQTDLAAEQAAAQAAADSQATAPEVGRGMEGDQAAPGAGPSASDKAQILEIMKALQAKQVQPEGAFELMLMHGVEQTRAQRLCGMPVIAQTTLTPATPPPQAAPDPKAHAPRPAGQPKTKATRATSGRSRSPFAVALRAASAGPLRSPSRASSTRPKR